MSDNKCEERTTTNLSMSCAPRGLCSRNCHPKDYNVFDTYLCPSCSEWDCSRSPFLREEYCYLNRYPCPPCPYCFWTNSKSDNNKSEIFLDLPWKSLDCPAIMCPIELCPQSIESECPPCPQVKCNIFEEEVECIRPCLHKECSPCPHCINNGTIKQFGQFDFVLIYAKTPFKYKRQCVKDSHGICRRPIM
jgi:hypothetical protein